MNDPVNGSLASVPVVVLNVEAKYASDDFECDPLL